ncbi:UDP-N-acetylmuramoylalanine/D-glutamate ligase [Xylanimonas cellulosilytica DSM 15894]|uniref:UDP-N-acetylmuramoylalanine--D-glutamate ligase n=1 Tax=Xylanimonas cellulosilytica (strain DSM 15894 / JCM 12276 / CECT 5975 / KCTC 9989 / LMG 20990 / NBRC 107835 / XIL07) TaxID=446471 RepID=D1C0C4_XYLCX|nr:UDP-N-acetylmuramoyl-L-alanine--D-glutamate ligase [Xylanimonas cellulosilytica]ACZ30313.1 UDP-N-acetylmuramoylalanine/D-glutamate ligase [Xylanimonas cellulosilytica DSM 15894]
MAFAQHGPVEPRVPLAQARVLVAGLGVTGRAVAGALPPHVASVVTVAPSDDADVPLPADDAGRAALLADADLLVTSPGFKPSDPLLVAAGGAGVPVWSEVELAWRLRVDRAAGGGPAPWLAVTGTNGKTTTVEMLASILSAAGLRTRAVGNVGTPLIEAALDPDLDVLAVELSSFQLHFAHTVAVQAGAILNLAEDHLDWHGTMAAYGADKGRIYERAERACVYNAADGATEHEVREADVADGARAVGFTLGAPAPGMLGVVEDVLVDRAFHAPADAVDRLTYAAELGTLADLEHLAPGGSLPPHVVANALAAAALARAHGVPAAAVRDGLRAFTPGGHRIQQVAALDGVTYVNDSKATNAHSAAASLAGFPAGSVVWVAGGLAKGARFDELVEDRADRLRAAVVIGVDPGPFTAALGRHAPDVPVVVVDPGDTGTVMRRAVAAARSLAQPGDTVLLAPAGASQDQFRSYAQRGEAFAAAVEELVGGA